MTDDDVETLFERVGAHVESVERCAGTWVVTIRPLQVNAQTFAAKLARAQTALDLPVTGMMWSACPNSSFEEVRIIA